MHLEAIRLADTQGPEQQSHHIAPAALFTLRGSADLGLFLRCCQLPCGPAVLAACRGEAQGDHRSIALAPLRPESEGPVFDLSSSSRGIQRWL